RRESRTGCPDAATLRQMRCSPQKERPESIRDKPERPHHADEKSQSLHRARRLAMSRAFSSEQTEFEGWLPVTVICSRAPREQARSHKRQTVEVGPLAI